MVSKGAFERARMSMKRGKEESAGDASEGQEEGHGRERGREGRREGRKERRRTDGRPRPTSTYSHRSAV